jgi:hypothetical protein
MVFESQRCPFRRRSGNGNAKGEHC